MAAAPVIKLKVTAGFYQDGECIAVILHNGTREGQAKAERVIDAKAEERGRQVSTFETQLASRWLASDVCQCINIGITTTKGATRWK